MCNAGLNNQQKQQKCLNIQNHKNHTYIFKIIRTRKNYSANQSLVQIQISICLSETQAAFSASNKKKLEWDRNNHKQSKLLMIPIQFLPLEKISEGFWALNGQSRVGSALFELCNLSSAFEFTAVRDVKDHVFHFHCLKKYRN